MLLADGRITHQDAVILYERDQSRPIDRTEWHEFLYGLVHLPMRQRRVPGEGIQSLIPIFRVVV